MSTYWDIKTPTCRHWHCHRQMRRWLRSLPSMAFEYDGFTCLIVPDWKDPCRTRIVRERIEPAHPNCRCVMVYVSINEEYFNEKA